MGFFKQVVTFTAIFGLVVNHILQIRESKRAIKTIEEINEKYKHSFKHKVDLTTLTPRQLLSQIIDIRHFETQMKIISTLEDAGMYMVEGSVADIMGVIIKSNNDPQFDKSKEQSLLFSKLEYKAKGKEFRDNVQFVLELAMIGSIIVNLLMY